MTTPAYASDAIVVADPDGGLLVDPFDNVVGTPSLLRPDPGYDVLTAFQMWAPGVVLQRAVLDALEGQYAANAFTPLTQSQVVAIAGPLPPYPTGLPRFADAT